VAGTGPPDLHALAVEYLEACIDALDSIPDFDGTLDGAPSRAFVAPGTPVFDFANPHAPSECDQLTVHLGPIVTGASAGAVGNINRVTLIATIARCCLPTQDEGGNAPSAAEQQAAAEQIHADKWSLWNFLHHLVREDLLFERCCDVIWGPLAPIPPSGGCGGSTLTVNVCFDGYEVVLGT
jgi:hypothetical protein